MSCFPHTHALPEKFRAALDEAFIKVSVWEAVNQRKSRR